MASFKIKWTTRAQISLNLILEFYIDQNGNANYSLALLKEIENGINILIDFPLSGKSIGFFDIRELVFERNSVFYHVLDNEVHILLIWDNRQNPDSLIKLLAN